MELLFVISIGVLLASVALPQHGRMVESFDRFNARAQLLEDIKLAQSSSTSEGCRGIFTIDADNKGYNFGCDYLSYDTNAIPVPDSISFIRELPGDVTVSADNVIIFNSRGQTVDENDVIVNVTFDLKSKIEGSIVTFSQGFLLNLLKTL